MVLPQAMAWVLYWFRVLSLKFCGKSKKNCGDISQVSPAFCMYGAVGVLLLPVSSGVFSESPLLNWLHFWLSQVCGSGGGCAGGCGGCADHLSPQPAPSPLLTASLSVPYDRPAPRAGESRQVAPSAAELPCRYIRQQHQRGKEEKRGPELPCRLTYIRQQHQTSPAGNGGENINTRSFG